MAKISDFLNKLADSPAFEREYDNDRRGTMKKFGLSTQQQNLILQRPLKDVKDKVKKELGGGPVVIMIKRG